MNVKTCPENQGLPAEIIPAVLTRIGYYRDTLPQLIISIPKKAAGSLPFRDDRREEIPLVIAGESYRAGMRSTERAATIQISPDLIDAGGEKVRLADLIFRHGFDRAVCLELVFSDGVLYCFKGTEQQSIFHQKSGRLPVRRKSRRMIVCVQ